MSGKNFMSFGDADTILTEFSNDIKSRVSTKANQGLTAQQQANAKTNIGIENVPNVATNDQTPTFLEESSRVNIASGDKLSLIFGKIKKFFSDLKAVAFTGSYNDLSDTPTLVECSTARNVAAKTVTLPGFKLKTGARISVRFTDTGTSNPASGNITLNVNGTGAKEIVDGRANMTKMTYAYGSVFCNNQVNDFIYDGTYWAWTNRDYNTTYSAMSTSELTTGTSTTARSVRSDYLKAGINSLIDTKIGGLDVASVGGSGKYISAISETDGKISATASNMPTIPDQLSDLTDDSTHRLVTDTEKSTWNGKCEGGNSSFANISIADQMDTLKAAGKSGLFPFYISSGNPDFSTTGYCMAIGAILNNGVSTITAVNSQTGDVWTNGNTSQGAGAWRGWKKIDAVIDLGSISATSNNDSFGKAWDAITVYDKPVIVRWFYSGSFMALMLKYSGSQYGMAMAMKYNTTNIFTLSINNGVKTYGDVVASGTKLDSSVSLNNYSSSTNKYTVPNDGYVMVYAGSGTGFSVAFDSVNSGTEVIKISSNAPYTRQSIFVKKGMKVYGYPIGGSSYQFYYYPLQ